MSEKDCSNEECLNDFSSDKKEWHCEACPNGGNCTGPVSRRNVRSSPGYWVVPWSSNVTTGATFAACQFVSDCPGNQGVVLRRGEDEELEQMEQSATTLSITNGTNSTDINDRGCAGGSSGIVCAVCRDQFAREAGTCVYCSSGMVVKKLVISSTIAVILIILYFVFRKSIEKLNKKYSKLIAALFGVLSISLGFMQIQTATISMGAIPYPPNVLKYLGEFNFVNFDIIGMIGATCSGEM